jgi:hypothetical protein
MIPLPDRVTVIAIRKPGDHHNRRIAGKMRGLHQTWCRCRH